MSHISSSGSGGGGGSGVLTLNVVLITTAQSPYAVLLTDSFIGVDSSAGPVTVLLPSNPAVGTTFVIKDVGGQAEVNNITLTDINGVDSYDNTFGNYIINTEYQSVNLIYTGSNDYYLW